MGTLPPDSMDESGKEPWCWVLLSIVEALGIKWLRPKLTEIAHFIRMTGEFQRCPIGPHRSDLMATASGEFFGVIAGRVIAGCESPLTTSLPL